eukprot:GHVO01039176.1.p1 GENE.GHVO01039176.1~~GHVO01039176.1.p1  ORF type:complete len:161 (-),score=40.30 GHVO01039176.1:328-810(-)
MSDYSNYEDVNPAPASDFLMDLQFVEHRMDFIWEHRQVVQAEIDAYTMAGIELECDFEMRARDGEAEEPLCSEIAEKVEEVAKARQDMCDYLQQLDSEHFALGSMLQAYHNTGEMLFDVDEHFFNEGEHDDDPEDDGMDTDFPALRESDAESCSESDMDD